jgi:hypothetical protein
MNVAISMLGAKVIDRITGFEGVVTSIGFDLYGCIQAIVQAPVGEKGEIPDGRWFDLKRLTETGRAMIAPKFEIDLGGEPGGAAKPPIPRKPLP